MFTGIVEELGQVRKVERRGRVTLIEIAAEKALVESRIGESISVNGCCLTIIQLSKNAFSFEVMPETLKLTNLGSIKINDKVNLERSLRLGDRISGHFVLGHIDCQGIIRKKNYLEGNLSFGIAVPSSFIKYCLPKGSVSLDGVSLTIAGKSSNVFNVYVIPHTLKNTTLGLKGPSDKVNVEFDLLAKKIQ